MRPWTKILWTYLISKEFAEVRLLVTDVLVALVKSSSLCELGLHRLKRLRLDASCGFYRLDAGLSSNCSRSVDFIKLQQVCENQT